MRQYIREQKARFTASRLLTESGKIINQLLLNDRVMRAKTLMFYASLSDEVATGGAILRLKSQGKRIVLPVVVDERDMVLREFRGEGSLRTGSFHILEPEGEDFSDYSLIDVAVIPGMAFDKDCHRLGRGKGYYDRFLPKIKHAYKIGVCFPFQMLDHVPVEENDVSLDEVIW